MIKITSDNNGISFPKDEFKYKISVDGEVVAEFWHRRSEGLCICLIKAARVLMANEIDWMKK